MLPAAKRGPHTNGLSPPNGRSTPAIRKLADDVLHWSPSSGAWWRRTHLDARPRLLLLRANCDRGLPLLFEAAAFGAGLASGAAARQSVASRLESVAGRHSRQRLDEAP